MNSFLHNILTIRRHDRNDLKTALLISFIHRIFLTNFCSSLFEITYEQISKTRLLFFSSKPLSLKVVDSDSELLSQSSSEFVSDSPEGGTCGSIYCDEQTTHGRK